MIEIQFFLIFLLTYYLLYPAYIKSKIAPIHDIYSFWILVFFLYTVIPPLFIFLNISSYDPNNRLIKVNISETEVSIYLNYVLLTLLGFFVHRLFSDKLKQSIEYNQIKLNYEIPKLTIYFVIFLFLISFIFINIIEIFFTIEVYSTRLEAYKLFHESPLWYKQINKFLYYFNDILFIICLICFFQIIKNKFLLISITLFYIIYLFYGIADGGRSEFFLGLFTIIILWHFCVSNISKKNFIALSFFALYVLILQGLLRNTDGGNIQYFSIGEFDVIYTNTIELIRDRESNLPLNISLSTHFADIFGWLPSQIIPYEKVTLPEWYIKAYDPLYYNQGGGYAFGIISQSVVGFGYLQAFLFGIFIAYFMTKINSLIVNCNKYWKLLIFIFLFLNVNNTIRSTFFVFVPVFIQILLPTIILIWFINKLFRDIIQIQKNK